MKAEETIASCEREWMHAVERGDRDACSAWLSDNYTEITGVEGGEFRIRSRDDCLATLDANAGEHLVLDDICVSVHGGVAIASCLVSRTTTTAGVESAVHGFLTDVWSQDSDKWRLIERHMSRPLERTT